MLNIDKLQLLIAIEQRIRRVQGDQDFLGA